MAIFLDNLKEKAFFVHKSSCNSFLKKVKRTPERFELTKNGKNNQSLLNTPVCVVEFFFLTRHD
eukprot:UN24834